MSAKVLTQEDERRIKRAVRRFRDSEHDFRTLAKTVHLLLSEHPRLLPLIHSVKWRVKDPGHLKHKLIRKTLSETGDPITSESLFDRVEDLAGIRILHLHTHQMEAINKALLEIFAEQQWIVSGPVANTWDDEFRAYYEKIGIGTVSRDSMYTSVHYVLKPNTRTPLKCELQVRTLVEEVWGEVSHSIDYPDETKSVACKEQLKVLARISSGCIRLVDSIFESHKEHSQLTKFLTTRPPSKRPRKR